MARGVEHARLHSVAQRIVAILIIFGFLTSAIVFILRETDRQKRDNEENRRALEELKGSIMSRFNEVSEKIRAVTVAVPESEASDFPDYMTVRAGHKGTKKLCGYSEDELQGILSLPHEWWQTSKRYFMAGIWMDWIWLYNEFLRDGPEEPVCILAVTNSKELRCSTDLLCVHAIHIRHKSSDTLVLRQLYEWGEQGFLKPGYRFNTILDAGANIGIASMLFASMFPTSRIVSVEASSRNYKSLSLNTAPYPNIMAINAALWPADTKLSLIEGSRNPELPPEWGFMVVESKDVPEGKTVEESLIGVSVPFMLKVFGLPGFDFLKIDIEGSEGELLTEGPGNDLSWVDHAKLMALELHGDMRPGSNDTVIDFFNSHPAFKQVEGWYGEYQIFRRLDAELE